MPSTFSFPTPTVFGVGARRELRGWLAKLGGSLPAGRYRVVVRARDTAGNKSRLRAGPSTLLRVKG